LLIVSNRDWVVPASITARRFVITEALDTQLGQHEHFAAIVRQMENGGIAAMLHDLLHRDISQFNVRAIPETEELRQQKLLSLPSIERWWVDVLDRGYLYESRHGTPWFGDWHAFYTPPLLLNSYLQWCNKNRPFDRKTREQLGTFFTKVYQSSRPDGDHPVHEIESIDRTLVAGDPRPTGIVYKNHLRGYHVGELIEARVRFAEMYPGVDLPWGVDPDE
jgi:hypothetical protein